MTLVPLLFTAAYHGTVDIPAAVRDAAVDIPVDVADVLGPVAGVVPPALVAGLRARLATIRRRVRRGGPCRRGYP